MCTENKRIVAMSAEIPTDSCKNKSLFRSLSVGLYCHPMDGTRVNIVHKILLQLSWSNKVKTQYSDSIFSPYNSVGFWVWGLGKRALYGYRPKSIAMGLGFREKSP